MKHFKTLTYSVSLTSSKLNINMLKYSQPGNVLGVNKMSFWYNMTGWITKDANDCYNIVEKNF